MVRADVSCERITEPRWARFSGCPFWRCSERTCRAASQPWQPLSQHQARYCRNDDHDACAFFLSRALRSSRTHGLDRDSLTEAGK